jgi:hypothetical protein
MAKGQSFERDMAKRLSRWITGRKSPLVLWRSVQSGGWSQKIETHLGDLAPISAEGHRFLSVFVVELKNYKVVDVWPWMVSRQASLLGKWWGKLLTETPEDRSPMLIVKRFRANPVVGIDAAFAAHVGLDIPYIEVGNLYDINARFFDLELFLNSISEQELFEAYVAWKN